MSAQAPVIDIHAHILVPEVYEITRKYSVFTKPFEHPKVTPEMQRKGRERADAVCAEMADATARLAKMDVMGVDIQVLTASIVHHCTYWAEPAQSLELERRINNRIAEIVATRPDRFIGLGGVPLHAPALAVGELERCMDELKLKGVQISTSAGSMEIGDPALHPFWRKAEELGAVIFIHPAGNPDPRFLKYQLWNSIGQNFEEAMAIASLFYEGVLDASPKLKICVSHGGGYMPFYMGRIDRNYVEKPATRVNMSKPPADYLRMLYYDTCVYDPDTLAQLIAKVGADRVLMGSDYPVGEARPVQFIEGHPALAASDKKKLLSSNAAALFGLT